MKNETWYNFERADKLETSKIIRIMTEKILRDKYKYRFTKAIFYNNQTGAEIKTVGGILKESEKGSR